MSTLEEQLQTATDTLKGFEGVDVEELQGKVKQLTDDMETQKTDYENKIAEMKFGTLIDNAIDLLSQEKLHWWKFLALFESLGEETKMAKIMYYRTVSTSGMSKDRRAFINEMKKAYKLDGGKKLTLEERNQQWKEYVKKRNQERTVK